MSRNNLTVQSKVFNSSMDKIIRCNKFFDRHESQLAVVTTQSSIDVSQLLTYVAICRHWKGNRLHCSVYHLKLSSYLDSMQRSWATKTVSEDFEYQEIWMKTAKVLIISGLDFISFKDFNAQTLLNLIHDRAASNLLTVVVTPPISQLVGDKVKSPFFTRMLEMLYNAIDTEVRL